MVVLFQVLLQGGDPLPKPSQCPAKEEKAMRVNVFAAGVMGFDADVFTCPSASP